MALLPRVRHADHDALATFARVVGIAHMLAADDIINVQGNMDSAQLVKAYKFRTKPFAKQNEALLVSLLKRVFALYMEQGTGKTKVIIDTAAILFLRGIIDALLIFAPNDVHAQWVEEQFPIHMPKDIPIRAVVWDAASTKQERLTTELYERPLPNRLAVLSMNHEALATRRGRVHALRFVRQYKVLLAIDESDLAIKNPTASRSKVIIDQVADKCKMRRILTGTPGSSPFELYGQFAALDWRIIGFDSFLVFKHRYATWTQEWGSRVKKSGERERYKYETLAGYQNLDELYQRINPFVFRCKLKDCVDMPEKIPAKRYTHLSEAQLAIYAELKEKGIVMLQEAQKQRSLRVSGPLTIAKFESMSDDEVLARLDRPEARTTVSIKLVLMLRLRQVLGGYLTSDDRTVHAIEGSKATPRMLATLDLVKGALQTGGKIIVWAQFRAELAELETRISELCDSVSGAKAVAIHGGVTGRRRSDALTAFKDARSNTMTLIAHEQSMGVGHNLAMASTLIYYTGGPSARQRMQSVSRAYRAGQTRTVHVYDLHSRDVPMDATLQRFRDNGQMFNDALMNYPSEKFAELL